MFLNLTSAPAIPTPPKPAELLLDNQDTGQTRLGDSGCPQCTRAQGEHAHCRPKACSGHARGIVVRGTSHPESPGSCLLVCDPRAASARHLAPPAPRSPPGTSPSSPLYGLGTHGSSLCLHARCPARVRFRTLHTSSAHPRHAATLKASPLAACPDELEPPEMPSSTRLVATTMQRLGTSSHTRQHLHRFSKTRRSPLSPLHAA